MAGYNKRNANATMDNPQAIRQREAINATSGLGLPPEAIGNQTVSGLGIARSQSRQFPDFPTLDRSINAFLETVSASSNPDFASDFSPVSMQSFNEIKDSQDGEPKDKPSIGLGPNLKVLNIDDVILGQIQEQQENISTDLTGNRGFGWNSDNHSSEKIGSYFKDNYGSEDESNVVIKGERIDTLAINYSQSYDQTIPESEE